jgi:hypothetical protein
VTVLLEVSLFLAAIFVGALVGGLVPDSLVPRSLRLPLAGFIVGAGIAIGIIGFSH